MSADVAKEVAQLDKLTDALKTGKVKTPDEAAAILQAP
jgi:hypothetical protein